MAITFQKQPLTFFNVFEPAIFEFTSDADLGVNASDLVADLQLTSQVTNRRYLIKNIPPNYGTGVFRIDVSGYLKALMLDNFDYNFDSPNAAHTVEEYSIGVDVHADNGTDTLGDEYVFDSGYVFDTTFVFAESTPSDTTTNNFFAILGVTNMGEASDIQYSTSLQTLLSPEYIETTDGTTLSVFRPSNKSVVQYTLAAPTSTLPTLIYADNPLFDQSRTVYGIAYQAEPCENTIQVRFFNSYGGYTYFYGAREADAGTRSGSKFVNNNFYNTRDGQTPQKLRTSTRKKSFTISGNKNILLLDSFFELLNSPSIFVLLDSGYVECEVNGSVSKRKNDFEYSLTINVSNINTMDL